MVGCLSTTSRICSLNSRSSKIARRPTKPVFRQRRHPAGMQISGTPSMNLPIFMFWAGVGRVGFLQ